MSVVPLSGPARLVTAEPPRNSSVEFTGGRVPITLPIRAALPVLAKARARDDVHPSVALLAGATLLGMRLVAAGKFEPAEDSTRWRAAGFSAADDQAVAALAAARATEFDPCLDEATAEGLVRAVLDAVVDAMPNSAPYDTGGLAGMRSHRGGVRSPAARRTRGAEHRTGQFAETLQHRLERIRAQAAGADLATGDLAQLVSVSLRMEADEEELVAGAVRLVLQVHDEQNPMHLTDAAVLWTDAPDAHGFGPLARAHAMRALHSAVEAWPVLDRFSQLRVPDQITLDNDELVSLLSDGVGALRDRGVDVLFPRSLGRDLSANPTVDLLRQPQRDPGQVPMFTEPLQDPILGTEALCSFTWQVALHGDPLSEEEMDELARAASPVMKLRGNWMIVDPAIAQKARKRLIRRVQPSEAVAAALSGVIQIADEPTEVIIGASLLAVREQLLGAVTGRPVEIPAALQATLRGYQHQGLTWLAELTRLGLGGVLADDMGLGKTITLIALHLHRLESGTSRGGPTLVVCPASLLGNWEAEIRRFAPGVPVRRFHGSGRDLAELDDPRGAGFVLTTYGTMRVDAAALAQVDWDLVVADEAQHVKNARSSTARALRSIGSQARVALTGTPVENELVELWALLDWVIPGLLGSLNAFRKAWAAPIESGLDPNATRRFAELISPFLLRRRKSDPGIAPELPPKTETDHLLGLTREQTVLYEAFVRDSMERIERSDADQRRGLVLRMLTGLKQICNHPAHFLKQANPRLNGRSEKLELLDELLGTVLAEDSRVLVFTQYVAMARLLENHLTKAGVPHQFLHGGVPVAQRERMVQVFQSGDVPVFLLSLKAGGTGLNLTAADHVVHFDRWWNPAVEDQATDRAYRIGQTRPVQVHRMVTQGTVEEKIAELLTRKRGLADAVLGRGEAALTELDNDQLRDLVELRR